MADDAEDDNRERLKASLWYAIGKIVDEESIKRNRNATPQFIGSLTELVMTQIESVAIDLESFSRHAGRTTINTDDVLLMTRRNDDLQDMIRDFIDKEKAKKARAKSRR
ncbi:kinetochore component CENP-S-domain-containing protein [Coniochaeta sp. 2T2.1]|nr:kinetochore component CENP-S-domain-containing protein [Coniochaeta sp. 2T2.1]